MQDKTESYYGGNEFLDLGFGKLEIKIGLSYILNHIKFISYIFQLFLSYNQKSKVLIGN